MSLSEKHLPLVTVVIPAYNHAEYLPDAVRSVLAQDYPRVELIVIDDGSTDGTAQVLASLAGKFHWESQSNIGQSLTLKRGWEMAQGEILAYLSADDVLDPAAVSASVAALASAPEAVATYCDFHLLDPESRRVKTVQLPGYSYEKMLTEVLCPVGPGAFFRRAAYQKTGSWNPSFRQMPDYDFWLRLGLHGPFIHLPRVLAGFRVHEGSQTYSMTTVARAAEPVVIVTNVLNENNAKYIDPDLKARALANANLVSAQLHARAGRFLRAVSCIWRAFRHSGRTVFELRTLRLMLNAAANRIGHRALWTLRRLSGSQRK